jgi:hypothetical protein
LQLQQSRAVAHYRVCLVTDVDIIDWIIDVDCGSDDEARKRAAELIGQYPGVDIWCDDRWVGHFTVNEL